MKRMPVSYIRKSLLVTNLFIFASFPAPIWAFFLCLKNLPVFSSVLRCHCTQHSLFCISILLKVISPFYSIFGLLSLFYEVLSILTLLHGAFWGIFNVFFMILTFFVRVTILGYGLVFCNSIILSWPLANT